MVEYETYREDDLKCILIKRLGNEYKLCCSEDKYIDMIEHGLLQYDKGLKESCYNDLCVRIEMEDLWIREKGRIAFERLYTFFSFVFYPKVFKYIERFFKSSIEHFNSKGKTPIFNNIEYVRFMCHEGSEGYCFYERFPIIPGFYYETKFLDETCPTKEPKSPISFITIYLMLPSAGIGSIYDPEEIEYKPSKVTTTYCEDYPFLQKDSYSELLEWYMRDLIKEEHKKLHGISPSVYEVLLYDIINEIAELTEFYVGVLRARK